MSNQAIAIKVETSSGERYFVRFGKGGRVQTAWSLAGAKLFLACTREDLDLVTSKLEAKNKKFSLVKIGVQETKTEDVSLLKNLITSEISDFYAGLESPGEPASVAEAHGILMRRVSACFESESLIDDGNKELVWMTRKEFNHYTAISEMKPVNLDFLREYALEQFQISKDAALISFWNNCNPENIPSYREDAFEWIQLARGLAREIKKQGGL